MDWEMDPGGWKKSLFWLVPPLALLHVLLGFSSRIFPTPPHRPPAPFFVFFPPGGQLLGQERQTFFLHLIRQLHQPQAPHLPGFHSNYTKHTMTSAGMTSAL